MAKDIGDVAGCLSPEDHPSIRAIRANHSSSEAEFEFKPVNEAKISCYYMFIQHLLKLAQMGAGKSVTEFFCQRKRKKWTSKVTDKQYVADSFLHSATYHYQTLNQISSPES